MTCKIGLLGVAPDVAKRRAEGASTTILSREFKVSAATLQRHINGDCACSRTLAETPKVDVAEQRDLTKAVKKLGEENASLRKRVDELLAIDAVQAKPGAWETPKKGSRRPGFANLVLSDLHLGEVVKPAEVMHSNEYNREIALRRLKRTFEQFVVVSRDHITGVDYEGAVVPMLGDTFSGNIHEELKESNEAPILDEIDYWIDVFVEQFLMLADVFPKIHVPTTPGNHGRLTRKPIMKGRVHDNFDWFFVRQLARALKHKRNISWQIEDAADCMMNQYDTTFLYTHGDQFRGGSGISGMLSPLMLGDHRKRKRNSALGRPYDVMVFGHWHTYLSVPSFGFIGNGSMKGYDEYAFLSNFGFEVPQQAFFVTTPERGVTFEAAIYCDAA